jgi:hypothetical protein
MKSIEKQFYLNTKKYFPDCKIDKERIMIVILDDNEFLIELSYKTFNLIGNEILEYYLIISFKKIEEQWLMHREELMYPNSYPATIFLNIENFIPEYYMYQGLNLSKFEIYNYEEIFDKIHIEYTIPLIKKYSDINELDKIINPNDGNVQKGIRTNKIYPIRAVLVAQMSNNPRLPEITNEMRKYCKDSYEMGIKDSYVPATKLLPVFEKMFGKE